MCDGIKFQVATMENGTAAVNLPVKDWRDVKAVRTEPDLGNAVRVLLAGEQVRIYGAPGTLMVDVCVEYLSDDERQARDKEQADLAEANVNEAHEGKIADAEAQVAEASDQHDNVQAAAEHRDDVDAERVAEAEARLEAAKAALEQAQADRDQALSEVRSG